jgi:hypothetical protein
MEVASYNEAYTITTNIGAALRYPAYRSRRCTRRAK